MGVFERFFFLIAGVISLIMACLSKDWTFLLFTGILINTAYLDYIAEIVESYLEEEEEVKHECEKGCKGYRRD